MMCILFQYDKKFWYLYLSHEGYNKAAKGSEKGFKMTLAQRTAM